MLDIVIVTHRQLGEALIDATKFIVGSWPVNMAAVSINVNENVDNPNIVEY